MTHIYVMWDVAYTVQYFTAVMMMTMMMMKLLILAYAEKN